MTDLAPRCGRCGEPVYLWAVQGQGACTCDACGLIVYEDGHTRELHDEPD